MKNISPALQSYLIQSNGLTATEFIYMDLYAFTLATGTQLFYTSADVGVVASFDSNTYVALGPKLTRDRISTVVGVQVDQLDLSVIPDTTDLVLGMPWLKAVQQGVFDGAWVSLNRLFLSAWPPSAANQVGVVNLFSGNVSDANFGRSLCKMTIKSPFERFNLQLPRNLYQPGCTNTLYDTGCTVNRTSLTAFGVTANGSTTSQVFGTGIVNLDGYYALGVINFTSGANNGVSRTVKANAAGSPTLLAMTYPLPNAPAPGDTFSIYPGCNKQQVTCANKFSNSVNFRATPFVPVPETAT
jgi:uncharacterized phage protein (TIGR02218 family)